LLWGVLAAVLNYIPYIGPAIVVGTLGVVGCRPIPPCAKLSLPPIWSCLLPESPDLPE
jgi:hypothetical protein